MAMARLALVALALLAAAALTACGGKSATVARTTTAAHGKRYVRPYVDIYAGLPLNGPMAPQGRAILNGIELAINTMNRRPGQPVINFEAPLDDSGKKTGDDNLSQTATNAGTVAIDPRAVYYIGDLSSAATAVSLPVLNAAGIAQLTPGDPYIPASEAALAPKLLRLLPDYRVQAAADVQFFKQIPLRINAGSCTRVLVVGQGDPESTVLVDAMYTYAKAHAAQDGVQMPTPAILTGTAKGLTSYQTTVLEHASPLTCGFVIAGSDAKQAVTLTKMIHSMFQHAFIVGTSGLCTPPTSKWAKAVVHEIPTIADSTLWCTSPLLPLKLYYGGDSFEKLYKSTYGVSDPSPYAFYGYEAAELGITTIESLGPEGIDRSLVRSNLFQTRAAVFDPYGWLLSGYSTQSSYGVYRIDPQVADQPTYDTTLRPQ